MIKWVIFVWTIVFCAWGYCFADRWKKAEREEQRRRKERNEWIRKRVQEQVKEEEKRRQ